MYCVLAVPQWPLSAIMAICMTNDYCTLKFSTDNTAAYLYREPNYKELSFVLLSSDTDTDARMASLGFYLVCFLFFYKNLISAVGVMDEEDIGVGNHIHDEDHSGIYYFQFENVISLLILLSCRLSCKSIKFWCFNIYVD